MVFQKNRTNRRERDGERERERDYEKLAHTIMEAEKSYDLPSVNSRPRKASGIIPV